MTRRALLGRAARIGAAGVLAAIGSAGSSNLRTRRTPPRAVVQAPPPTGGDDSAMLAALCVGDRDVHLRSGATYLLAVPDAISGTGFTGRVIGNGATLRFGYTGRFSDRLSAINGLEGVSFQDMLITAPECTLFSIFRNCAELRLQDVIIYACSPKLTYAMPRGFSGQNLRWTTIGADPATVDGSLYVPDSGHFSLVDFEYDTVFTGKTGAIVSAVATVTESGATVLVARGRCFVRDLPGYSVDGVIDIEPVGSVPFDNVTVQDLVLYNTNCYLSGANQIDVRNVSIRYTARNSSGRAVPFIVYNNNPVRPALGDLRISDCQVEWSDGNPTNEPSGILNYFGQPRATISFLRNRYRLGFSSGQAIESLYWVKQGAPSVLTIDGDVVEDTSRAWVSPNALVEMDEAVDQLIVRNSTFQGSFARRLSVLPDGGGGTSELIALEGNDFTGATFRGADYVDGSVTVRVQRCTQNAGDGC